MRHQSDYFHKTDIEALISVLELMKKDQATIYQFDKLVKSLVAQSIFESKITQQRSFIETELNQIIKYVNNEKSKSN